jgi:leader peptidase (prepilin peptidase) / N-methyltransferase
VPDISTLPQSFLIAVAFVLGCCMGSFANVLIHRLPRDESIAWPRSYCPRCGDTIPALLNIPVVAYLVLRGRCRNCRARISARYPIVEALTGVLFVLLLLHTGPSWRLLINFVLATALIAITFIDAEHQIIPNAITYPGIAVALPLAWLVPPPTLLNASLGMGIGYGMMWSVATFYHWRTGRMGLGFGDVKLIAMLGGFLGLQTVLGILVLGSLMGLAHGMAVIALRGGGRQTQIPFGPALALAGILHLFDPELLPRLLDP